MTRCNSEACTRLVQAKDALASLERALHIVDALELSTLVGARIQHAIDTLESELTTIGASRDNATKTDKS